MARWNRRLAAEVAIPRWDAQHAVCADGGPSPDPLDGDVAAAGIEEFMIEFPPGLLAHETTRELSGTLHLHATDGPPNGGFDQAAAGPAVFGPIKADTAVRGTRSDLLLWLTNPAFSDSLDVLGGKELLVSWRRLRR